jgi:Holliday junction resolvase RusA-like endonuclease
MNLAMSDLIEIELPAPVSANEYWIIAAHGSVRALIRSEKAKRYIESIRWLCKSRRIQPRSNCAVTIDALYRPNGRFGANSYDTVRLDTGNVGKVIEDALQGVLYANDRQIIRSNYALGECVPLGCVHVRATFVAAHAYAKPLWFDWTATSALIDRAPHPELALSCAS